jgi:alpha-L-rhamnosidase
MMNYKTNIYRAIVMAIGLLMLSLNSTMVFAGPSAKKEKVKTVELLTEYKTNPLGIDVLLPRLSWKISSPEKDIIQSAYHIQAALTLEDLKKGKNLVWDSKKVNSSQSIHVEYKGKDLQSGQRVYWKVKIWTDKFESKWSSVNYWEMGLLDTDDWEAQWISTTLPSDLSKACPVPMFRKEFSAGKKILSASVNVTSLGIYDLRINGSRVGEALYSPGWTSYNKRLQYQTYDVTEMLQAGKNAIGATVGDGWYRGHLAGWANPNRNHYGDELALLLQLKIVYVDGTYEIIVSDQSWKNSTGPILAADFYHGESYDARLEKEAWDKPDYDDSDWISVKILKNSKDMLIAQTGPLVKKMLKIKAIDILVTPEGDTVVDMGQNMVGWIKFTVRGKKGHTVLLRHAEVLDKDGNFYTLNLKGAKQEISYTFGADGEISFEPHFTFQGFRYFTISGLDYMPELGDFTGEVIYSDMEISGEFTCSDPMINKLQENIQWGQRGNFLDVPTDCPQRQERLGWTGDAQVFAPTAAFNMDVATFFTKWLGDVSADQREDGSVGHIIPFLDVLGEGGGFGSAAWADAATVIPYTIYQYYGDTRILEDQYESMKAWVEYMRKEAGDGYLHNTGFHYGDWLAFATDNSDYPGATTAKDFISSAYFAYSTSILIKTAEILGKSEDAEYYSILLYKIKVAFDNEFISKNGRVSSNTQTAYALALAFNLVPKEKEALTAERYVNDIRKFGHITTGFVGTPLVCHVLTKYGYNEDAFKLLIRKEYPSWLYPVTKGATTIWERWDGIRPDGTFNTKGAFTADSDEDMMNSFNHYSYGAIGDWMYKVVAGINYDEEIPGFKKIIIKPTIGGDLKNASAKYESMYGTIASSWRIEDAKVVLEVEIPPNTTATIFVPDLEGNYVKHETGSGKYVFSR